MEWKEKFDGSNEQVCSLLTASSLISTTVLFYLFLASRPMAAGEEDERSESGEGEGVPGGQEEAGGDGEAEPGAAGGAGQADPERKERRWRDDERCGLRKVLE